MELVLDEYHAGKIGIEKYIDLVAKLQGAGKKPRVGSRGSGLVCKFDCVFVWFVCCSIVFCFVERCVSFWF